MKTLPSLALLPVLISAGAGSVAAQTQVRMWGRNFNNQNTVPDGLTGIRAVSAGDGHSLALRHNGTVAAWGSNSRGQINVPAGLTGVTDIYANVNYSLAHKSDGTVVPWGTISTDRLPPGLSGVTAIATLGNSTIALNQDGTIVPWVPAWSGYQIPTGLAGVVEVAAGNSHFLALRSDGGVVAWGNNSYGESTVPPGLTDVVAVAAGNSHSLALKADGTVTAWGYNFSGEATPPAGLSGVVAIGARGSYSLALKTDGTVKIWGNLDFGVLTVPADLKGVLSVSAGSYHCLAVVDAGSGPPVVISPKRWTTEATGARGMASRFRQRIVASAKPASFTASGLPPGLTLNPTTGLITGSATQPGVYPVTLTAANAAGTGTQEVSLTVFGLPRIFSIPPAGMDPGDSLVFSGAGATYSATGLPPGLTLDAATGHLTGTAMPGKYEAAFTVSNPYGSVTQAWPVEVAPLKFWGSRARYPGPPGMTGIVAASAYGDSALLLKNDGTVAVIGGENFHQNVIPEGLSGVVAVAMGGTNALALCQDGTLVQWGYSSSDGLPVPAGLKDLVAIAAGSNHYLALKNDGTVVAWGYNDSGQCAVPGGLTGVVTIAAGQRHSLAVKSDGTVVAWGENGSGQATVPAGLADVVAVAGGRAHSLALKRDGTVIAWGNNFLGQTKVPVGLAGISAIASGSDFSLALRADGSVAVWGASTDGVDISPPQLTGAIAIAAGGSFSLALPGTSTAAPLITVPKKWITEAAGARNTAPVFLKRITATGSPTAYAATGLPPGLQLDSSTGVVTGSATRPGIFPILLSATNAAGTGTLEVECTVLGAPKILGQLPSVIEPGDEVSLPMAGTTFSATGLPPGLTLDPATARLPVKAAPGHYQPVLTASNAFGSDSLSWPVEVAELNAWGYDYNEQSTIPAGLTGCVAMGGGGYHSVVLLRDGTVRAWGHPTPSAVPGQLRNVTAIAVGTFHTLALKLDGTVSAWGENNYAQSIVPAGLTGVTALAAGEHHSVALKSDGSLVMWGDQNRGQRDVPAGMTGVVALAAGYSHTLALQADGKVFSWGENYSGQISMPEAAGPAVAIAGGRSFSLALMANGTVYAWGLNDVGQTDVPVGLAGVVAIAAGEQHALALKADGTLVSWGGNQLGQRNLPPYLTNALAVAAGASHSMALVATVQPAAAAGVLNKPFFINFPRYPLAAYSATGLPPGLSIESATGVISGVPTEAGTWSAVITTKSSRVEISSPVAFTVTAGDYASWSATYWARTGEILAAEAAPGADPDGDGRPNLVEYWLGTSPLTADPTAWWWLSRDPGGHLVLTLDIPADRAGLVECRGQFSADTAFAPAATDETDPAPVAGAPAGLVRWRFEDPEGLPAGRRFGRLKLTVP